LGEKRTIMPHYLVERTAADRLGLDELEQDGPARRAFMANNRRHGVTWLHSYVAPGGTRSFCLYEAPTPLAIRLASQCNGLPIDRITAIDLIRPSPVPDTTPGAQPQP
jgi:hypothetical protein